MTRIKLCLIKIEIAENFRKGEVLFDTFYSFYIYFFYITNFYQVLQLLTCNNTLEKRIIS